MNFTSAIAAMVAILVGMLLLAVAAERQSSGLAWLGVLLLVGTAVIVGFFRLGS